MGSDRTAFVTVYNRPFAEYGQVQCLRCHLECTGTERSIHASGFSFSKLFPSGMLLAGPLMLFGCRI